jgi:hypothetical protein
MPSAPDIPVRIFREIMVLPLRLQRPVNSQDIEKWIDSRLGAKSSWREVIPGDGAPDGFLRHVPPSKIYTPAPLRSKKNDDGEEAGQEESTEAYKRRWAYAEAAYFHPFTQRFLYGAIDRKSRRAADREGRALRLFRRREDPQIARLRVTQGYRQKIEFEDGGSGRHFCADSFRVDLAVERLDLYVIPEPGLAMLVIEVGAAGETKIELFQDQHPLPATRSLTLAEALCLHDALRRVYPPFISSLGGENCPPSYNISFFPREVVPLDEKGKEIWDRKDYSFGEKAIKGAVGHLLEKGELPVAPWWRKLASPIFDEGSDAAVASWRQVVDDRMPTMVFVAVESSYQIECSDRVRLVFADAWEAGLPYSEDFLADFEKRYCYTRFEDSGTLYMMSSYSFVTVVSAGAANQPDQFSFAFDVLQEHFRRHYYQMFFIVHMQRAALLMFSNWMSGAIGKHRDLRSSDFRSELRDIRHKFLIFTHSYWFSNVSNQEQAREMFALLQVKAGNHELYGEVMAESAAAKQELDAIANERLQNAATFLNFFFALAAIIGVPMAIFQGLSAFADKLTPRAGIFFVFLSALFALTFIVITAVETFQAEGAINLKALRARLRLPKAGSESSMRWFMCLARLVLFLAAMGCGWFAFHPPPLLPKDRLQGSANATPCGVAPAAKTGPGG